MSEIYTLQLTEPQRSALAFALLNEIHGLEHGREKHEPEVLVALKTLEGVRQMLEHLANGGRHD